MDFECRDFCLSLSFADTFNSKGGGELLGAGELLERMVRLGGLLVRVKLGEL